MTILGEECAEVIQETCKIKRFGLDPENLERFEKELGDLLCMIEICHEADLISFSKIDEYILEKREKLRYYSEHL